MASGFAVWHGNADYRGRRGNLLQPEMERAWLCPVWEPVAAAMLREPDLHAPAAPVPIDRCVDAVATVLRDPPSGRNLALMNFNPRSPTETSGAHSVGKSSVLHSLLGLHRNQPAARPDVRVIVSDVGYLFAA